MAFVKLKNLRGEEITVPKGSVEMFRGVGFFPEEVSEGTKNIPANQNMQVNGSVNPDAGNNVEDDDENQNPDPEKTEDEIFIEEVSKKPLSSWNKEEVKRYAAFFDIDLTGTKNIDEGKARIKSFMADAE